METDIQVLATEIRQRMDAVSSRVSDEALDALIAERLNLVFADPKFARTMRFASDPRLAGSKYGRLGLSAHDIEMLYHILSSAAAVGRSKGPSAELTKAFEAISAGQLLDVVSARAADVATVESMFGDGRLDKAGFDRAIAAINQVHGRAMDTAETGYGLELVGAAYATELWAGARAKSRVFSLLPTFPMNAATEYLPVEAALPEMLFVSESTASNSSDYTTSKTGSNRVQVDAKKFVIHQKWSGEIEEDSLIPFLPFLREQASRSISHYSDSLALNGDTTNAATGNINLDDADPADTKHYLAFDGIRHAALVDNTNNKTDASGALTYAKLQDLRGSMIDSTYLHDWGHPDDPSDLIYVADPATADAIGKLDEVITIDKYGVLATVLTGEVGNIGRNPLLSSIAVSKTEADGKVSTTGGNNTKGQVVAFNRRAFTVGIRRSLKVETERLPGSDQNRLVFSLRLGFGRFSPTGAASGIEGAAVLYNI